MALLAIIAFICMPLDAGAQLKKDYRSELLCSSRTRLYAEPSDCYKFIRCVNGKPVTFTCPPNTAFDPELQVCAWGAGKSGCGEKAMPKPNIDWSGAFRGSRTEFDPKRVTYIGTTSQRTDPEIKSTLKEKSEPLINHITVQKSPEKKETKESFTTKQAQPVPVQPSEHPAVASPKKPVPSPVLESVGKVEDVQESKEPPQADDVDIPKETESMNIADEFYDSLYPGQQFGYDNMEDDLKELIELERREQQMVDLGSDEEVETLETPESKNTPKADQTESAQSPTEKLEFPKISPFSTILSRRKFQKLNAGGDKSDIFEVKEETDEKETARVRHTKRPTSQHPGTEAPATATSSPRPVDETNIESKEETSVDKQTEDNIRKAKTGRRKTLLVRKVLKSSNSGPLRKTLASRVVRHRLQKTGKGNFINNWLAKGKKRKGAMVIKRVVKRGKKGSKDKGVDEDAHTSKLWRPRGKGKRVVVRRFPKFDGYHRRQESDAKVWQKAEPYRAHIEPRIFEKHVKGKEAIQSLADEGKIKKQILKKTEKKIGEGLKTTAPREQDELKTTGSRRQEEITKTTSRREEKIKTTPSQEQTEPITSIFDAGTPMAKNGVTDVPTRHSRSTKPMWYEKVTLQEKPQENTGSQKFPSWTKPTKNTYETTGSDALTSSRSTTTSKEITGLDTTKTVPEKTNAQTNTSRELNIKISTKGVSDVTQHPQVPVSKERVTVIERSSSPKQTTRPDHNRNMSQENSSTHDILSTWLAGEGTENPLNTSTTTSATTTTSDASAKNSTSSDSITSAASAAVSSFTPGETKVSFKSAPYMVQGLTKIFKCPEPEGRFPDRDNCAVYYHCDNGVAYRRDCPVGQLFHTGVRSCVSKSLVIPCVHSYSNQLDDHDDIANRVCKDANGLYKDSSNCGYYFECTDGWPIRRKCMTGTVFDEVRGKCTWSEFVPGCEGQTTDVTENSVVTKSTLAYKFECPRDGYFRDPNNCAVYYLCSGNEPLRMSCDPGTSFDVTLNMCVWSSLVKGCEKTGDVKQEKLSTVSHYDNTEPTSSQSKKDNFKAAGVHGITVTFHGGDMERSSPEDMMTTTDNDDMATTSPDDSETTTDSENSVMSNGGNNVIDLKSPDEYSWSSEPDFTCPEASGIFLDPQDCSVYYTCTEGTAKRKVCPYGTGYDVWTGVCMDSQLLSRCLQDHVHNDPQSNSVQELSTFECPESHGLYPDQSNCSSFIHCFNGQPYKHGCQEGTVFSAEIAACTWPDLVPECRDQAKDNTGGNTVASGDGVTVKSVPYQQELPFYDSPYFKEPLGLREFVCPSVMDGFYRDNMFCDIFHRCVMGTKFTFTCPTGTFFRLEGKLCDFWETMSDCTPDGIRLNALGSYQTARSHQQTAYGPETAPIPGRRPEVQEPMPWSPPDQSRSPRSIDQDIQVEIGAAVPPPCPSASGLFPHPDNCQQFLFCARDVPLVLTCPETLLYNTNTLTCDFAKNVHCLRYDYVH